MNTPSLWWKANASVAGGLLFCALAAGRLEATDYFVREQGDDGIAGSSITTAWRTIERVNRAHLLPGDRVLFEAGKSFRGNLRFSAEDAGTSNAPVVVGSFGKGRATILASTGTGVTVENAGGFAVENLVVMSSGPTTNTLYGLLCDNTLTNSQRLAHLRIENVEAVGFGIFGILVGGATAGFEHVLITNCVMRNNLRGGMEVAGRLAWDSPVYAHADVRVTHCQAYDNTGNPEFLKNHSGSGMVLYQVDGGRFDHCAAWNNGLLCRANNGGVGIWTCASRRVTIEFCESFANRTSGADGGGFDIDGGSVDCILQYNYSHDNDGPGLMVYTYPYASFTDRGNVVRFNISENDARRGGQYAGLWVRTDGNAMSGVEVYNNTVVVGPWAGQAARVYARGVNARIRNNIFVGTGPSLPLRVDDPGDGVRFENNLYWREQAPTQIAWGDQTYNNLATWREGTGQEKVGDQATGWFAKPDLSDHSPKAQPGQRLGLTAGGALRPLTGSPALAGGLDLRNRFGLDTGSRDFLGHALPLGRMPLGAIGPQSPPPEKTL